MNYWHCLQKNKSCFKDKQANECGEKPGNGMREADCSDKALIFILSLKKTLPSYFKHVYTAFVYKCLFYIKLSQIRHIVGATEHNRILAVLVYHH